MVTLKIVDITEFFSLRGGGVRSHLHEQQQVLCQLGHKVVVYAPGAENRVELFAPNTAGANLHWVQGPRMPYDPSYHFLWNARKLSRLLAAENADVLEIHSPYVAAAAALRVPRAAFGIRTFVWHSDFIDTYARVLFRTQANPLFEPLWAWVRKIAGACDATFVASRTQARKLIDHGIPRVEHIPFGVDKDLFQPGRGTPAMRSALLSGAPENTRIVVAIGRLAKEKRFDLLLDGFSRLSRMDALLIVLGDGPERRTLEAKHVPNVRFLGFEKNREKLAAMFASADLLVHTCPYETFGLGVAEALACGLPALLPDEGGAAEWVDGHAWRSHRSLDVESFARELATMLDANFADLRAGAVANRHRIATTREHFEKIEERYRSLLKARSARQT